MSTQTKNLLLVLGSALIIVVLISVFRSMNRFNLPEGSTTVVSSASSDSPSPATPQVDEKSNDEETALENELNPKDTGLVTDENGRLIEENEGSVLQSESGRTILQTDGVLHSVLLEEIQAGGPPKDGIPSIDNPSFITTQEADQFLDDVDDIGLGVVVGDTARFYPYQILVFHEIVNDTIEGQPVAVTYCPLCATGVVFDAIINGQRREFGVSGLLWQSNVLMYDRTGNPDTESLWSQVLGEAVLGPETGKKLTVLPSDTVRYGQWKELYPDTEVLSRDTGAQRNYGNDPYGSYYQDEDIIFGDFAFGFTDERLHPKEFVIGIEVDGTKKAYPLEQLPDGDTVDVINDRQVIIRKTGPQVNAFLGEEEIPLSTIDGFWFSWLSAHPDTLLWELEATEGTRLE